MAPIEDKRLISRSQLSASDRERDGSLKKGRAGGSEAKGIWYPLMA